MSDTWASLIAAGFLIGAPMFGASLAVLLIAAGWL